MIHAHESSLNTIYHMMFDECNEFVQQYTYSKTMGEGLEEIEELSYCLVSVSKENAFNLGPAHFLKVTLLTNKS